MCNRQGITHLETICQNYTILYLHTHNFSSALISRTNSSKIINRKFNISFRNITASSLSVFRLFLFEWKLIFYFCIHKNTRNTPSKMCLLFTAARNEYKKYNNITC